MSRADYQFVSVGVFSAGGAVGERVGAVWAGVTAGAVLVGAAMFAGVLEEFADRAV